MFPELSLNACNNNNYEFEHIPLSDMVHTAQHLEFDDYFPTHTAERLELLKNENSHFESKK